LDIKAKAIRGVAWTAVQRGGTQFVSFIVFTVLSRFLEPEAFGLVAIATVFIIFIQIFLDQGLSSAIIQRDEVKGIHLNTAFWSSILLGGLLTAGGFFISGFVANLYNETELKLVLQVLSLSLLFHALSSTQQAFLKRELAFERLTIRTLAAEVAGGIVGILMAVRGHGVWSLVGRNLVRDFTGVLVLWTASPWRPSFSFSSDEFRGLFKFGVSVVGDRFFFFIIRNLDQLLIGYFLGSTLLGYYVVGIRLIQLFIKTFLETITVVAFPVLARLQSEEERLRQAFLRIVKLSGYIAIPSFIGIGIIAPEVVLVFFGEKWVPSVPVMRVLSILGLTQSISYLIPTLILAKGKPNWRLGMRILRTFATILAIYVGVQWGIVGVAIAFVFREIIITPISFLVLQNIISYRVMDYLKQFIPSFVSALLMGFLVILLQNYLHSGNSNQLSLILMVGLGALVYGFVLNRLEPDSIHTIFNLRKYFLPEHS
jgi:PST family polysaccharide transporter